MRAAPQAAADGALVHTLAGKPAAVVTRLPGSHRLLLTEATGTLALAGNSVVISNLTGSAVGPVVTNANGSAVSNATLTVGNSTNASGTYAGILQNGTGGGVHVTGDAPPQQQS